ncbi:protein of unknown function [Hyphomicrobium sp. 1Nfss2.1]
MSVTYMKDAHYNVQTNRSVLAGLILTSNLIRASEILWQIRLR